MRPRRAPERAVVIAASGSSRRRALFTKHYGETLLWVCSGHASTLSTARRAVRRIHQGAGDANAIAGAHLGSDAFCSALGDAHSVQFRGLVLRGVAGGIALLQ